MTSLLMLTIDRFDLTKATYLKNIYNATFFQPRLEIEVLICDNGSSDRRIVDFFATRPEVKYHRVNSKNEGISKSFNQLYLRAKGDTVAFIGPDLEMPNNWLEESVNMLSKVPKPGIMGFEWGHSGTPEVTEKFGVRARWLTPQLDRVFGPWIMKRELIEETGLFHEGYGPYGLEDSDFNSRVNMAGFNSFYHPTLKSKHLGHDVGEQSEYRKMKDESLGKNLTIFSQRIEKMTPENIKEPLPEMRDPI